MPEPVGIGVIGLGRRWRKRYRPALQSLPERFKIAAVYDQVRARAEREARRLNCFAAASPTLLLEQASVQAVLLADAQWFGLWPIEAACGVGKPVLCGVPLDRDADRVGEIVRQTGAAGVPVMVKMVPHLAPASRYLRSLLKRRLGSTRFLQCNLTVGRTRPHPRRTGCFPPLPPTIFGSGGVGVVNWCTSFVSGEPVRVRGAGSATTGFSSLWLEYADGRGIQINRFRGATRRSQLGLNIVADNGSATLQWPNRVTWTNSGGRRGRVLPWRRSIGQLVLVYFDRMIQAKITGDMSLAGAARALAWLRAAQRSQVDGYPVDLNR